MQPPSWLVVSRLLGKGGMGQVYEALDTRRSERVAVKTLTSLESRALLGLKNEFRTFADVVHPNLVSQYELLEWEGQWFLLMELLEGVDLLHYVRRETPSAATAETPSAPSQHDEATRTTTVRFQKEPRPGSAPAPLAPVQRTPGDPALLSPAALQLALAIHAIHRSGHLHRDVKSSNTMVTGEGRAVLLDFGIAIAMEAAQRASGEPGTAVGTAAYMAPELLLGAPPSAASDWYSFGVMLFEALSGVRPYAGSVVQIVDARIKFDTTPILRVCPTAPAELAALIDALLSREPSRRPTFPDIVRALGGAPSAPAPSPALTGHALVGRTAEQERVWRAAEASRASPQALFLSGRSGVGKTALLSSALERLEAEGATVLHGRCYQQESVPYQAIDRLVDALAELLRREPGLAPTLPPDDAAALLGAFPVLRDAVATAPGASPRDAIANTGDLQRRALEALFELLQGLARRRRLVCYVDDLQWGDAFSVALLAWLARPTAAPALVLGSFRSEDEGAPALEALRASFRREVGGELPLLPVHPLGPAESASLARELAQSLGVTDEAIVRWAEAEAQGEPLFLQELLLFASSDPERARAGRALTLREVTAARVAGLTGEARRLFEAVALAGHGLPERVATRAAGQGARRAIAELRAARLLRSSGGDAPTLDTYHDKIREVTVALVDAPASEHLHGALFDAWSAEASTDARTLYERAHHALRAGAQVPPATVVGLHLDAARAATSAFDSQRARSFLIDAQAVAQRQGVPFGAEALMALGDACLSTFDVGRATEAYQRALGAAADVTLRGRARFGLARLRLGQLDTLGSFEECNRALVELGQPPVKGTLGGVLAAGLAWLRARLSRRPPLSPGPAADRRGLLVRLYTSAGQAGYFLMNRLAMLEGILSGYGWARLLPPRREKSDLYVTGAVIAGTLFRMKLRRRLDERAAALAQESGDPFARALAGSYGALSVDLAGAPLEGAARGLEVLRRQGRWLENGDFLTLVAGTAWNLLMRGHAEEGWKLVELGLERLEVSGGQVARGHTFRCYAGPLLAMLGRGEEGAAHLANYQAFVREHVPRDVWRNAQLLAHQLLFAWLTDAPGEALERLTAAHDLVPARPAHHPQQLRHAFVARGWFRLEQALAEDASAPAKLARELKVLHRFDRHPSIALHCQALEAGLAWLHGGDPRPRLSALHAAAAAAQTPWVALEAALLSARWELSRGDAQRGQEQLAALEGEAKRAGLHPLAARAARLRAVR